MKKDHEIAMTGDMSDAAIGQRARVVRVALGTMTQAQLAERLQISTSAVKAWETPGRKGGVRAKHIRELSDMAGIRSDFIIYGDIAEVLIRREFWLRVRAALEAFAAERPSEPNGG